MNSTLGDVCYWELFADPAVFMGKHRYTTSAAQIFINIALDKLPTTVTLLALQGTSKSNSTAVTLNATQGRVNRFPLSAGTRVILMAYPTSSQALFLPQSLVQL